MPGMTIDDVAVQPRLSDYVDLYAKQSPDSVAIVCSGQRITYSDLQARVDAGCRALIAAGIRRNDRVAMLCTPCADFWIAFLATTKIGAIWLGLNPRYSIRECEYVVADAEPRLLITLPRFDGVSYEDHVCALTEARTDLAVVTIGEALPGTTDVNSFLDAGFTCSDKKFRAATSSVETLDPALIVYTSGSTGSPKGAVLSHYGLCYGATMQTRHFGLEHPSLVVSFPINHVASVADTCATTLVRGGKIVFQEQFDPSASVQATVEERCSMIAGVPTMFQMQMAQPGFEDADLSALELILWGGAAMPVECITRLKKLNKRMLTAYGMTETACHVTYTDADADVDVLANSVGRGDPNCGLRIETADGAAATEDNPGELQVQGEFLMLRYWNRDEATADAFTDDGWLKTGDVAYQRIDGNLRLVGRMSDMFKSGGYNVYPREIEIVLEAHPAVALAAVVAAPDPLYQEVGVAYLQIEAGQTLNPETATRWCRERLANYKVPKSIRVLDTLPLLPVGKVDKQVLKKRHQ